VADELRVSNAGLQVLAAHCEMVATELISATPRPSGGLAIQATSAAVGTAYAALSGAVTVLAGRAQTSGIKAATTGGVFVATDGVAAQDIAAVNGSIPGVGSSVRA
jgi:hypothetical protein